MRYKYIFIGAGVANLAAANRLLSYKEDDFIILEKGNKLKKRHCPGVQQTTCTFCNSGCYVTEGIGGADALFGNKLCYFPASNEITSFFTESEFSDSMSFLDELLHPFFNSRLNTAAKSSSTKKEYNSVMLSPFEFQSMIELLCSKLYLKNKILEKVSVKTIGTNSSNEFLVTTESGQRLSTENIVLGSGKSSVKFLRKVYKELDIKYTENCFDVGIRIEGLHKNFSEHFYYQNDPKIKFTYPGLGNGRTFCAISHGQIVPVQFGESFYADGIFMQKETELNNIALMARIEEKMEISELENWCKKINASANQNLFIGQVDLNSSGIENLPERILDMIPSWPTKKHEELMYRFLNDLFNGPNCILEKEKRLASSFLRIYAPAIDNYMPKPLIGNGLSTSISNLHVTGDAVGVSRGYVQALFSGVAWATSFINQNLNRKVKEKQWSSLV